MSKHVYNFIFSDTKLNVRGKYVLCMFAHKEREGKRRITYHLQRQHDQRPLVSDNLLSYQAHSESAVDRLKTEAIQTDSHVSII